MNSADPLAGLPGATADAVRAELRAGERVAYAGVPMTMYDAGDLRAQMISSFVPLSACVVTDQRAILLATWPSRSVLSIEARDITEVFCWIVSPKCGHVRFQGGIQSTEANSLMYVPNPRACEAAMAALRDSSRSAGALQTAG